MEVANTKKKQKKKRSFFIKPPKLIAAWKTSGHISIIICFFLSNLLLLGPKS